MKLRNCHIIVRIWIVLASALMQASVFAGSSLDDLFLQPPLAAKPRVMWMWMGSNLSKQGITRDLEALQEAGFGGTLMFSCADTTSPWPGEIGKSPTPEIVAFTPPWWQMVRHAAMESARLGLDFGTASSPGYSTSGGPWITPELSMLQICFSQVAAKGQGSMKLDLPQPTVDPRGEMKFPVINPTNGQVEKPEIPARRTFYRDIAVLALPTTGVVRLDQVINLTGKAEWDVPAGEWTIYRFGYTTKGILLQPPQWQAQGLECDKLNPDAVAFHLDHVLAQVREHVGDLIGKGFNFIHLDSYEAGVPEWTPRMREEFLRRRGYDLQPFLATLAGRTVGSKEQSDRYRADFKQTVRDLFRDVYYKTFRDKVKAAGLEFSSEPYGGEWNQNEIVPQVDRLVVEFWTSRSGFGAPTIAAQQRTGRVLVEAEAFTGWPDVSQWSEHPAWLKPIGDKAFCAGINRLVLHRFVQQPWDDRFQPGNTMGWWGTHFDRTQTWWQHGKAMVSYWARCQALLQWGQVVIGKSDFAIVDSEDKGKLASIHRQGREGVDRQADIWFVANGASSDVTARCRFAIHGKQPELWDAVTGETRMLSDFSDTAAGTELQLEFAPGQSFFIVFRQPSGKFDRQPNFYQFTPHATLEGAWQVRFDPKWGGPADAVRFNKLEDWTKRPESGIRFFSGTAVYRQTFSANVKPNLMLDLGLVRHTARVRLNDRDLGALWTAPWRVAIPDGVLRAEGNELEIEVANVWANRLIGDEHEPADCEWLPGARGNGGYLKEFPHWFLNNQPRPSKGRYCFTTWNYFTKDSPLVSSGLMGPVRLLTF